MPAPARPLRLLFSFARGRGHLVPLVPIARAAAVAGHETALVGARAAVLEQTGFGRLHPRDIPEAVTDEGPGSLRPEGPSPVLRNMAPFFLGDAAEAARDHVTALARDWPADVVVCDRQDFGAMVAAERVGIPVVVVDVFATMPDGWVDSVREPMQAFRAAAGLGPDPELRMIDGDLTVVPFPPALRGDRHHHADVVRMRPAPPEPGRDHPALAWLASGPEEHRVYVTLGTVFNTSSGDLIPRILAGLQLLPCRVLLTTGPRLDPALFPVASGRLRVERHVPQDGVLELVDLAVTHGGSGSLAGALSHAVPSLVLPLGADQLPNAERLVALGAGAMLEAATATPADVARAARRLLRSEAVRRSAQAVRAEMDDLPPVDGVVRRIVGLVRRRDAAADPTSGASR